MTGMEARPLRKPGVVPLSEAPAGMTSLRRPCETRGAGGDRKASPARQAGGTVSPGERGT